MKNHEMMQIEVTRLEVLDLTGAIRNVIFGFCDEIEDENTSDERKRVVQIAIDNRWKPLLDKIEAQFAEQD